MTIKLSNLAIDRLMVGAVEIDKLVLGGVSFYTKASSTVPTNTTLPSITNPNTLPGVTLTSNVGAWDWKLQTQGSPVFDIMWMEDGIDTGVTASTFSNTLDGKTYTVKVRARNSLGEVSIWYTSSNSVAIVADTVAPTLSTPVLDNATGQITITNVSEPGTLYAIINHSATALTGSVIEAGVTGATEEAYTSFAVNTGNNVGSIDKSNVVAGNSYVHITIKDPSGNYSADAVVAFNQPDLIAPVLTNPTNAANGSTASTGSVSTDTAEGTLYYVVSTSNVAPTAAQVKLGQDNSGVAGAFSGSQTVSATGVQTITPAPSGLTASTMYYTHFMHEDVAGNQSIVSSATSFTTAAAAGAGPTIRSTSNTAGVNGASVAVTMPANIAIGDNLLVAIGHGNGVTVAATGWTQISTIALTSGTTRSLTVFKRTADGTEGASQTFNFTGGWSETGCVAIAMQNATTIGTPVTGSGAYATTYTGPTVSVAANSAALTFFLQNTVISGPSFLDGVDGGSASVAVFGSTGLTAGTSPAFTGTGTGASTWAGITLEVS